MVGRQGDAEGAGGTAEEGGRAGGAAGAGPARGGGGDGTPERKTGAGAGCREEKPVRRRTRTTTRGVPANSDLWEMTVGKAIVR